MRPCGMSIVECRYVGLWLLEIGLNRRMVRGLGVALPACCSFEAALLATATLLAVLSATGCSKGDLLLSPADRAIRDSALILLSLKPDVEWTSAHNELIAHGAAAIDWIARQPAMSRPVAPDNLDTLLHTSLIHLLAGASAPRLSFSAYETTLDLLYFDPRVDGKPLGEVCIPPGTPLVAWHDAYPHRLDRALADRVDAEADREAILKWWQATGPAALPASRKLKPNAENLWPLLVRRPADVWQYDLDRKPVLVADSPQRRGTNALIESPTIDYNLVRAACIWLGSRGEDEIQARLIELVNHPRPVLAHNAVFALRHSPDPRIRETLERFERGGIANTMFMR